MEHKIAKKIGNSNYDYGYETYIKKCCLFLLSGLLITCVTSYIALPLYQSTITEENEDRNMTIMFYFLVSFLMWFVFRRYCLDAKKEYDTVNMQLERKMNTHIYLFLLGYYISLGLLNTFFLFVLLCYEKKFLNVMLLICFIYAITLTIICFFRNTSVYTLKYGMTLTMIITSNMAVGFVIIFVGINNIDWLFEEICIFVLGIITMGIVLQSINYECIYQYGKEQPDQVHICVNTHILIYYIIKRFIDYHTAEIQTV